MLPCGAALISIWGFKGIKDQAPVIPKHVECHFFPERVRHLSPRYFSHKLFLHSLCFVTDRLHSLSKQCILPLVSEMCFPVLKNWFLSIYFGSFLKVKEQWWEFFAVRGPTRNRHACSLHARYFLLFCSFSQNSCQVSTCIVLAKSSLEWDLQARSWNCIFLSSWNSGLCCGTQSWCWWKELCHDTGEAGTGCMGKCNGFKEDAPSGFGAIL